MFDNLELLRRYPENNPLLRRLPGRSTLVVCDVECAPRYKSAGMADSGVSTAVFSFYSKEFYPTIYGGMVGVLSLLCKFTF